MPLKYNQSLLTQSVYQLTELQNKAQTLRDQGHDIINATIGDPKDNTPDHIRDALIQHIQNTPQSQYPVHIGCDRLRSAIAHWASRTLNVSLNPDDHILTCNGTKEAIFSLPMVLDKKSKSLVCIPSLSYPVYQMSAAYHGLDTYRLPLSQDHQFLPDLDQIPRDILNNTQLFWINSPHNPTTSIASKDYLKALIQLAETYDFLICSDECYNDLYETEPPPSILSFDSKHWVCFRSLSKRSHMTGYRSGAILSKNEDLIAYLKKIRSPMGVGTPSFIQEAAISAWNDDAHVDEHRIHYQKKRTKIKTALTSAGFEIFGGNAGFYMWVKSPNHSTSHELSEWFLNQGVLVTPGTVFGDDGNPYIRLVYCLQDKTIDQLCKKITSGVAGSIKN